MPASTVPVGASMGLVVPRAFPYKDIYPGGHELGWVEVAPPQPPIVHILPVVGSENPRDPYYYPLEADMCASYAVTAHINTYGFNFTQTGWHMLVVNQTWMRPTMRTAFDRMKPEEQHEYLATNPRSVLNPNPPPNRFDRPSFDRLSSSVSTGFHDDGSSNYEDDETVESLMYKLAIERRVQYGAEKMLDVIETRTGADKDQVRNNITAQLEVANDHIKALETRLERLRGNSAQRRRPRRPNGLSTSASSTLLSAGVRPKVSRQGSFTTDDHSVSTPPGSLSPWPLEAEDESDDETIVAAKENATSLLGCLRGAGEEALETLTRLTDLFKNHPTLYRHLEITEIIQAALPQLADSSNIRRRSAAYRLLRYSLDRRTWGCMVHAGLEAVIIRTFTRDAKAVLEREQALLLLRAVTAFPPPSVREKRALAARAKATQLPDPVARLLLHRVPLRQGLVRAIVSAAENIDDVMRTVCMETLVEIALLDLECLLSADSFRVVLNAFKDGPFELGLGITGMLCYLANTPHTRHLLIPGSDFEIVLVGLTEEYGKVSSRHMQRYLDRLDTCVRNVGMVLGTWAGVLYLCMDHCRAIKSLISSLFVPIPEMRNALLDLFFSAFRIKAPSWTSAFLDGRRLTVYNRTYEASTQFQDGIEDEEFSPRLSIVDNYVAFLLAVFIEAGLLESLVALIQEDEVAHNVSRKATLLLGEILQLANHTLPLQYAARIQALPRLFTGVAEFTKPTERNSALAALSSIDSLARNNLKRSQAIGDRNRIAPRSVQESLQRSQRQVQQVKLRLGLQIEDKAFQAMVNDSGVLLSRDHNKWNYDVIMELLQGPLLNPRRLDEVIRATKFIRRIFSFLHPFNNRFSAILRTRPNHKWVRLGCALLNTMLVNPEGQRYLADDKLLRQMVECLAELDQYAGQPSAQPLFARDRLENTLTYGYFEMIGTLTKHHKGIQLLEKFKFFTSFYHLCELRSRDDIVKLIIECFDYSIDAHQRIVLSKALTSSYLDTRSFTTHHLGRLLNKSPELTDWALTLLVTQLYDPAIDVCEIAVMYLEEACTEPVNLEKVVYLCPSLEHLGELGANLFLRFMSTSTGFQYLLAAQYIDYELESWMAEHNMLYVIEVETFVSKTIRPLSKDNSDEFWAYEGTAPTHFFRELCKTPEGCEYLHQKGIVPEFAEIIRLHGMETEDTGVLNKLKAAMWVMGNIGSTEGGLAFLEDEDIIKDIIDIAERSPVLTMKGTGFFVIGLISSTQMGAEILEEYGWIAARTPLGQTTGLCLPNDIGRFAYIEPWKRHQSLSSVPPLPALSGLESEVMNLISNLSNYVLAAGAMNNLKRIRNRHPRLFSSTTLFYRALRAISTNHFQAPVRRFICDLFSVEINPQTLLKFMHLERTSPAPPPEENGWRLSTGSVDSDTRRRARSSPGPEPTEPYRSIRPRGVTVGATSLSEADPLPTCAMDPRGTD
ncbi:hypothetical protein CcaverHIS641_0306150 [Cutaneotrichosporon cavernicola]|nr:hypothetical protein CcaverHIS641_0306150 [Cutaneotrichosporon cavernicola]